MVDCYVLSAPYVLPDLYTVKEYKWQVRKLRDMAIPSKSSRRNTLKYSINGRKLHS